MIVGRERNEAEGLQSIGDGAQHLCTSEHCAGSSQEYQFDLRSLDEGLRERKQTTGERNHLEVGRGGLAICKPKHCRILALQMSARKTPRRVGLGRAAHIRHQYVAEWLLTEDYESARPGGCELWRAALASVPHREARLCVVSYFGHIPSVFYRQRFAFRVLRSGLEALPHERANQDECDPKAEVLKAAQERLGYKIITEKQALNRDFNQNEVGLFAQQRRHRSV
ncbi:MAG TPA: hypothetical protein VF845_04545 [Terriglobales bacterium]